MVFLTIDSKRPVSKASDLERIILKHTRVFLEQNKPIELLNADLNSLDIALWYLERADIYRLVLFACRVPAVVDTVIVFNEEGIYFEGTTIYPELSSLLVYNSIMHR